MSKKEYFMRWFTTDNTVNILSPIQSPFNYQETILSLLRIMPMKGTIEFIDQQNEHFCITVQEAYNVLSHVVKEIYSMDKSFITAEEWKILSEAAPWDFWKNHEVQKVVNKIISRRNL